MLVETHETVNLAFFHVSVYLGQNSVNLGHKDVRLDLHQATHDGFCWPEHGVHGGGACGGGGARASEVMLCSSTINWVSHI